MLGELIGEFKGRNIGWRVLPDGKIETTAQGMGKLLGVETFILSTSLGTMANGIFMGEVNSAFTTMEGDTTTYYLYKRLNKYNVQLSTLARGVAIGDELEYTDEITLGRSITNRTPFINPV